ncbi:hypothetical protein KHP62_04205 [Rhodobacteraceae bacterium NNCM2]|nr:hypothetical protein [Coraliihabitans acroporae]
MVLLKNPPVIAAEVGDDLDTAALVAKRSDPATLAMREQASRVRIDMLPYLIGSDEGRAFLQAAGSRALARGEPALSCPATAVVQHAAPVPRETLAREVLTACLADLPADRGDCGCRVVAIDDLVSVPREDLAYATGSSARLSIPAQGIDGLLVAEEDAHGNLLLRDLTRQIARVDLEGGERVSVRFENGDTFKGRRIQVGFRRGRLAERIYAENADGQRLSLLIGFEPDELAERAGAWLAWPKDS